MTEMVKVINEIKVPKFLTLGDDKRFKYVEGADESERVQRRAFCFSD